MGLVSISALETRRLQQFDIVEREIRVPFELYKDR